jgi:hypothetical protein
LSEKPRFLQHFLQSFGVLYRLSSRVIVKRNDKPERLDNNMLYALYNRLKLAVAVQIVIPGCVVGIPPCFLVAPVQGENWKTSALSGG